MVVFTCFGAKRVQCTYRLRIEAILHKNVNFCFDRLKMTYFNYSVVFILFFIGACIDKLHYKPHVLKREITRIEHSKLRQSLL